MFNTFKNIKGKNKKIIDLIGEEYMNQDLKLKEGALLETTPNPYPYKWEDANTFGDVLLMTLSSTEFYNGITEMIEQNVMPYDLLDYIDNKTQWEHLRTDTIFFIEVTREYYSQLNMN
jgi:hypothetical protein